MMVAGGVAMIASLPMLVMDPVFGLFLALATSCCVMIGHALALPFFLSRIGLERLLRSATAAAFSGLSATIGGLFVVGPILGWLLAMSFSPHHAAMTGWLLGIVAISFLTTLGVRLLPGFRWLRPGLQVWTLRGAFWGFGGTVLVASTFALAAIGVPMRRLGTDAAYEAAIGWTIRAVCLWLPLATVAGCLAERWSRRGTQPQIALRVLWMVGAALVAVDTELTWYWASNSDHARWWAENRPDRHLEPLQHARLSSAEEHELITLSGDAHQALRESRAADALTLYDRLIPLVQRNGGDVPRFVLGKAAALQVLGRHGEAKELLEEYRDRCRGYDDLLQRYDAAIEAAKRELERR